MPNPTLRLRDGFANKSPHLRDDVKKLQQALKKAGYRVGTDGLFGQGTQTAVKQFQRDRRLVADGIVGAGTWRVLGIPRAFSRGWDDARAKTSGLLADGLPRSGPLCHEKRRGGFHTT